MISVVAYSLIEEAPHDIHFFWTISGYSELLLMTLIFLTTFFWNLRIGIAVGIGLSLLRLLRHSTRPRIQILGRVPGTQDFENAETDPDALEFASHCLIVKIPEPLTFANTGSLKDRLRRLEDQGSAAAHPSAPPKQRSSKSNQYNRHLIFDIHGVTALDPAACQVLLEIVESYIERGTRVYFSRIPSKRSEVWRLMQVSGIVDVCGGERYFLRSVSEALKMSEREETASLWTESARASPEGSVLGASSSSAGPAGAAAAAKRPGVAERDGESGFAAPGEAVAVEPR
jgi:MFS superfamily sulfate permease-like transporter